MCRRNTFDPEVRSPYRVGEPVRLRRGLRIPATSVLFPFASKFVPGTSGVVAACDRVGDRWMVHVRWRFCSQLTVVGLDAIEEADYQELEQTGT